jgi:triosephosphate isomerase
MKKFYVVGNLKMNQLSRDEVAQYLAVLLREAEGKAYQHVVGIVCPAFVHLAAFDHLPNSMQKGAQDVFWEKSGAYTGDISPIMLKNEGVEYVIIGHSERREFGGETDEIIRKKVDAAFKHHLTPIVCVGETLEERKRDETASVLARQIKSIFSGLSKLQAEATLVAYEPRWAISSVNTGVLPTTADILQIKIFLRKLFTELFDARVAERIPVLYGGSVKSDTLPGFSWEAEMSGVLVGGESRYPRELIKMMDLFEGEATKEK